MIVADYLAELKRLPLGTTEDLIGNAPFLVLSPHPDDETLGCGGLLALTAGSAASGHVLMLTDGAGSHPGSLAYPADRLVPIREAESIAALRHLGLPGSAIDFLRCPDTALPSSGSRFTDLVEAVVATARRFDAMSLFVTWGLDPHCDHEAAAAIAVAAARVLAPIRLWAYPIWGWHLDPDASIALPEPRGYRLPIGPVQTAKHVALTCYVSQMTAMIDDDPTGFSFTQAQLEPFLGAYEYFIALQS